MVEASTAPAAPSMSTKRLQQQLFQQLKANINDLLEGFDNLCASAKVCVRY